MPGLAPGTATTLAVLRMRDVAGEQAAGLRHKRVRPSPDLAALIVRKIALGQTFRVAPKRGRR